jgi:hypothetical protein
LVFSRPSVSPIICVDLTSVDVCPSLCSLFSPNGGHCFSTSSHVVDPFRRESRALSSSVLLPSPALGFGCRPNVEMGLVFAWCPIRLLVQGSPPAATIACRFMLLVCIIVTSCSGRRKVSSIHSCISKADIFGLLGSKAHFTVFLRSVLFTVVVPILCVIHSYTPSHFVRKTLHFDCTFAFRTADYAYRTTYQLGNKQQTMDSIPDHPARSQSLYRLSYPPHAWYMYMNLSIMHFIRPD